LFRRLWRVPNVGTCFAQDPEAGLPDDHVRLYTGSREQESNVTIETETAHMLGIAAPGGNTRSAMWISRAVTEGLPLSALESVVLQVAPHDKNFVFKFISRPTLARRRKACSTQKYDGEKDKKPSGAFIEAKSNKGVLSPDEGAKVARLAEVWAMAREVWGSDEEARAFLFRPHPMLEENRPIDVVLATEFGRPVVEGILGRLQYGSAA
jgi:uncharacterized protein (DUF2384 family)